MFVDVVVVVILYLLALLCVFIALFYLTQSVSRVRRRAYYRHHPPGLISSNSPFPFI